jgi:hypothetical protein
MLGYAGILIGVPVAAAVASVVSLRRVQISPLGVSRKVVSRVLTKLGVRDRVQAVIYAYESGFAPTNRAAQRK